MAIKRMLIPGFSPAKELDTRANQSTCGRLKTIRIRCVWTRKFSYSQKNICRKKKFPDMCGHGLSQRVQNKQLHIGGTFLLELEPLRGTYRGPASLLSLKFT